MDKQQADKIITEYLQKIYGFAIQKSFSYEEAEELCADIVHEVYCSLLRARQVVNVEGYIWRISEHTFSKYVSLKKKQEGISIDGMEIPFYEEFLPDDSDSEVKRLRREIAFLTEKRRRIVYLFYYKDMTVASISRLMGIPEGTVKWHLSKARNELKEGLLMERNIGKLGLSPVIAKGFSHSGHPSPYGGPEYYLGDKLNLNIVYSVYFSPKTKEEIAEELGVTPVFIEDKVDFLESNGFLVRTSGNRFTTYVQFTPETFTMELIERKLKMQLEAARLLAEEYAPLVREAVSNLEEVYIPGGNRELLEAAAVFYGIVNKCGIPISKDLSTYEIKTIAGGRFIATVELEASQADVDYKPTLQLPSYWVCGDMTRASVKYPAVFSWSVDSRYCSREGGWKNNETSDYEYLYEFLKGTICDDAANADKFKRLRERAFITEDNQVNIMIVKGKSEDFFAAIPEPDEKMKERFSNFALELAMIEAKSYPPQMQDLVVSWGVGGFIGRTVALMAMDVLYGNGTWRPLTENEKVTADLIMFSDILP